MKYNDLRNFLFGTLRGHLIISVAVVHAIMMTLFIIDLTFRQKEMLLDNQELEAMAICQSLATSSSVWIISNDLAGLMELIISETRYPELQFALLTDKEGRILAHTDKSKIGLFLQDIPNQIAVDVLSKSSTLIDVVVPIMLSNDHIGWARVGLGQKKAEKKLAEIMMIGAIYAFAAILIGSLIAWFLGIRITRRLYAVQNTMVEIKRGIHSARSEISGTDEAASIAKEFNSMLDKLDERDIALQLSEAKYRQIFDNVLDSIELFEITDDGKYRTIDINPAFEKTTGILREQIAGKLTEEFFKSNIYHEFNRKLNNCLVAGIPLEDEIVITPPSGKRYFYAAFIPIRDEAGKIYRVMGMSRDITELRMAEEEKTKLSLAVNQSPISIVITDRNGNIEYVNPKFIETTGYSFEEIIGKNPRILKGTKKTPEEYKELWSVITSGKEWHGEFHNKRKDGTLFWEKASISPIKNSDGKITHFLGIKEDISEKKLLEENLKIALDKSTESDKLKSSLLANMSHEFRTPMVGILGLTTILKEQILDSGNQTMLDDIISSAKRLQNTLDAVLEIANLDANYKIKKSEKIDISKIAQNLLKDFLLKAKKKGLSLTLKIAPYPIFIISSSKYLTQIISQLLDNAVKFTEKGEITLFLETEFINENLFVKIKVKDTGIGIEGKNISVIFEEFRQVSEGFSREYEGAGLGLSLVKRIVNLMNGYITVESKIGRGSTFSVFLPIERIELQPEKAENQMVIKQERISEFSLAGERDILLVEDNFLNRRVIANYLNEICNIDQAKNGADAINMCLAKQYQLILMDINLGPGIDGVEAAKKIRTSPNYKNIPIVAVTGYSMDSDKERFLASGFSHYLSKPFEREDLFNLVSKILN